MNKKHLLIVSILIIALILGAMIFLKKSENVETSPDNSKGSAPQTTEQLPKAQLPMNSPSETPQKAKLPVTLEELPTVEDMQALSGEEVHHTPQAVIESGKTIGAMIDQAEKNPEMREAVVDFLVKCAEQDNVVNSIRAVCWNNTLKAIKNWKVFVPITEVNVPDNVKALSSQLP